MISLQYQIINQHETSTQKAKRTLRSNLTRKNFVFLDDDTGIKRIIKFEHSFQFIQYKTDTQFFDIFETCLSALKLSINAFFQKY
jgi:hypothetical protein